MKQFTRNLKLPSKKAKLKLPPQLLSIILGEEKGLCDQGFLPGEDTNDAEGTGQSLEEEAGAGIEGVSAEAGSVDPSATTTDLMNLMLARSAAACEVTEHADERSENQRGPVEVSSANQSSRVSGNKRKQCLEAPKNTSTSAPQQNSVTKIVLASQSRFTKELCSYTRAVCMRLGYA